MLNPETSSLSASLKSKGARWVSARVQINQIGKKSKENKEDWDRRDRIEKDNRTKDRSTTKVLKTDSYEIDWATERRLPIKLYLELEDHPAIKTGKTMKEPKQKNTIKEKFKENKK